MKVGDGGGDIDGKAEFEGGRPVKYVLMLV